MSATDKKQSEFCNALNNNDKKDLIDFYSLLLEWDIKDKAEKKKRTTNEIKN